jgi:hypothetical protein
VNDDEEMTEKLISLLRGARATMTKLEQADHHRKQWGMSALSAAAVARQSLAKRGDDPSSDSLALEAIQAFLAAQQVLTLETNDLLRELLDRTPPKEQLPPLVTT